MTTTRLFLLLTYRDTDRTQAFLQAVGFTERVCYRDDNGIVVHAQAEWPGGGAVMYRAAGRRAADDAHADAPGQGRCYCVVSSDEAVDEVFAKALAWRGQPVQQPTDADYGGYCVPL